MYSNGIRSYRKTNVVTADSGRLVLMCYEGAIDNLKVAIQKYQANDYEGKYRAIDKAEDIIDELRCSLDFKKGGVIAGNLESLYNYMSRRILQSDVNKDISGLNEVVGMLEELKSAWEIVIKKQARPTQPNAAPFGGRPKQPTLGRIST